MGIQSYSTASTHSIINSVIPSVNLPILLVKVTVSAPETQRVYMVYDYTRPHLVYHTCGKFVGRYFHRYIPLMSRSTQRSTQCSCSTLLALTHDDSVDPEVELERRTSRTSPDLDDDIGSSPVNFYCRAHFNSFCHQGKDGLA